MRGENMPGTTSTLETQDAEAQNAGTPSFVEQFLKVLRSKAFLPGISGCIAVALMFWPLLSDLPEIWLSKDGYYSHAPLVPLIAGYIIYSRWSSISSTPVRPSFIPIVLLALLAIPIRAAYSADITGVLSLGLILVISLGVWFIAGGKWAIKTFPGVAYLAFALPVFTMAIDNYTNPLQQLSTKVALAILKLLSVDALQISPTDLAMPSGYMLNIAIPCSGLKLLIAVTAFTTFFVLIARLKWYSNLLMFALVIPLCLSINGLRIALIGVVGNFEGAQAAASFHDYSGYITLIICFVILFKTARILGWK